MIRTRWVSIASAIAAFVSGISVLALNVSPQTQPSWLRAAGLWYQPYAFVVAVGVLAVLLVAQVAQAALGGPSFRKKTIQGVLDVLAAECGGRAKVNRVTLFKRVSGFTAFWVGIWRLRWRYWLPEKRRRLKALWRIEWAADYLYVYVRSSSAKGRRSTAAFRVSDREHECEGVAGQVWEWDSYFLPNLPRIRDTHRAIIRAKTLDGILQRNANDRLRQYVEATRIKSTEQLRATETFSRHFMGQTVHTPKKPEWGVLLLDSSEDECPFPHNEDQGGQLGRIFRTHGDALGHVIQGN